MLAEDRSETLRKVDIFSSFSDEELEILARSTAEVCCQPGDILLTEGEEADSFFVLLEGKLEVFKGKRVLSTLTPIDYVGEMAVIDAKPRSATVKACAASLLLRVPAEFFQKLLVNKPQSLLLFMKILSRRVRQDNEVIAHEFEQINMLVHDMKNLFSVFFFLDSFQCEKGSIQEKHVHFMKMARNHLMALVNQALANVKKLVVPERLSSNSLQTLLDEMRESDFVTHPELKDKKIIVDVANDLPEFTFSKLHIRRVLLNLLINAAQASEAAGKIELTAFQSDRQVFITVKDQGCGISDAVGRKMFESHYTTKSDGNGLGLSSCKQIVEQKCGGKITYTSSPEEGTIFTVSLPFCVRESALADQEMLTGIH
ncbi:MAG: cyclic nucleotide-binding domain-containing protein [Deltaproteobacteria bacterium]|nr:cyclic nucleotide-binding domain-containing protein [Deltaproteobacteria bacterium]